MDDKDSAEQEGNSSFSISNNGFLIDYLGITGFSVVCAWHFLIIFSAGPTINAGDATGRDLIYQLTLYFSLGISYVVLQLLSKPIFSFLSKDNNRGWNRASLAFGGFASASTVFMISTSNAGFSPIAIASWAVLGLSEAFLMLPWLQLPRVNGGHETESPVNLAFNMGIGGVLAFIIGNLAAPYSFIAIAALPIISCVTLAPYGILRPFQIAMPVCGFLRVKYYSKTAISFSTESASAFASISSPLKAAMTASSASLSTIAGQFVALLFRPSSSCLFPQEGLQAGMSS